MVEIAQIGTSMGCMCLKIVLWIETWTLRNQNTGGVSPRQVVWPWLIGFQ